MAIVIQTDDAFFIVGIKSEYLRGGLDPGTVDLFPPDWPADESPGLESILDPAATGDLSLRFDELERLRWLPPRDTPPGIWRLTFGCKG